MFAKLVFYFLFFEESAKLFITKTKDKLNIDYSTNFMDGTMLDIVVEA